MFNLHRTVSLEARSTLLKPVGLQAYERKPTMDSLLFQLLDEFISFKNGSNVSYDGPRSYQLLATAINTATNTTVFTKAMVQKYVIHRKSGKNERIKQSFVNAMTNSEKDKLWSVAFHPQTPQIPVFHPPVGFCVTTKPLNLSSPLNANTVLMNPSCGVSIAPPCDESNVKHNSGAETTNLPMTDANSKKLPGRNNGNSLPIPYPERRNPIVIDANGWGPAERFSIGFNVDFVKDLVYQEKDGIVRTYFTNSAYLHTVYYACAHCGSRAKLDKKQFFVRAHKDGCQGIDSRVFHKDQCLRHGKHFIAKGVKPKNAHEFAFKKAVKLNCYEGLFPQYYEVAPLYRRIDRNRFRDHTNLCFNDIRWRLHDNGNMQVYSTDRMLKTLAQCKVAVADGTFYSSPTGFYQMMTIIGLVETPKGSEYVPLVMALLPDKTKATYSTLMDILKDKLNELGVEIGIERLHCDYEPALQQAFKDLVGDDKVFGCSFHYNQAVLQYCVKQGLYEYYMSKSGPYSSIRLWIRLLLAWPTLPKEDAKWFMEDFLRYPPANPSPETLYWPTDILLKVADYMRHWAAVMDNTLVFYGLGRTRNTNAAEGLHGNLPLSSKKPAITQFLDEYQRFYSDMENRIIRLNNGAAVRRRNPMYVNLQLLRQKAEDQYHEQRKKLTFSDEDDLFDLMLRFVRKMSHLSHEIRNKSAKTVKSGKTRSVKHRIATLPRLGSKNKHELAQLVETDMMETGEVDDEAVLYVLHPDEKIEDFPKDSVLTERPIDEEWEDYDALESPEENAEGFPNESSLQEELIADTANIATLHRNIVDVPKENITYKHLVNKEWSDHDADRAAAIQKPSLYICGGKSVAQPKNFYQCPSKEDMVKLCLGFGVHMERFVICPQPLVDLDEAVPDRIVNVVPDGHCGFRSISMLLTGSEAYHMQIRQKLCTDIAQGKVASPNYYDSLGVDIKLLERKAKASSGPVGSDMWIDVDELVGFAILHNVNVAVWNTDNKAWTINNSTTFARPTHLLNVPTLLLYLSGSHFQAVLSLKKK